MGREVYISAPNFARFVDPVQVRVEHLACWLGERLVASGIHPYDAFAEMDTDSSGTVTPLELSEYVNGVLRQLRDAGLMEEGSGGLQAVTVAEARAIMRRFDADGSAKLSASEFVRFLRAGAGRTRGQLPPPMPLLEEQSPHGGIGGGSGGV